MAPELSMTITASWAELEKLNEAIQDFALQQAWSDESLFQVSLVLEELITNVINHGSTDHHTPQVDIQFVQNGHHLTIDMADTGIPFDPLLKAPPDLEADIDERPIGGLGVFLVRELMDEVLYQRIGDRNQLRLTKQLHMQGT